jgi:hypothetical protein
VGNSIRILYKWYLSAQLKDMTWSYNGVTGSWANEVTRKDAFNYYATGFYKYLIRKA